MNIKDIKIGMYVEVTGYVSASRVSRDTIKYTYGQKGTVVGILRGDTEIVSVALESGKLSISTHQKSVKQRLLNRNLTCLSTEQMVSGSMDTSSTKLRRTS